MNELKNYVSEEENKLTDNERLVNFKEELAKEIKFQYSTRNTIVSHETIEQLTQEFKELLKLPREISLEGHHMGTGVSFYEFDALRRGAIIFNQ